jgi:hypothetical protein
VQVRISSVRRDSKSPLDDTPGMRITFVIDDALERVMNFPANSPVEPA